ncbi:hypothetical protein [Amycolatopsis echigonensis]|uniref:Uncharacterized protein n=1 Tax=Amycolatopsis echigonensis TaxID=2576905 RepID=A0A8E1W5I1_9PSEU|nr:hypothetical protein [Amycolatopsis echigonensis]MBB2504042.1 hypothetical protein [Amycolatopsis echigonensis]
MTATTTSRRRIGSVGTTARVVVGLALLAYVAVYEQAGWRFVLASWLLGVVGLPAAAVAAQWWRARRTPARLDLTGPWGYAITVALFLVLFLPQWFIPGMFVLWAAGVIFFGASMVLAVSNWLLRRDDQVGWMVFTPVDQWERQHRKARRPI